MHLIEESLAAAIGAGVDIAEPVGRMVVDIGGGTSEVAVISLGGLVVARSLRVGGYDLDDAITNHIRLEHRMAIGSQSAEAIKLAAGSAIPLREEIKTSIRGRDLASGLPREIVLTSEEVRHAIAAPLAEIMAAIHATLEETPPELAADITTEGVLLAGGGSLLRGFDDRVARETGHAGPASPTTRWRASRPAPGCPSRNSTPCLADAATAQAERAALYTARRPGQVAERLKALAC